MRRAPGARKTEGMDMPSMRKVKRRTEMRDEESPKRMVSEAFATLEPSQDLNRRIVDRMRRMRAEETRTDGADGSA